MSKRTAPLLVNPDFQYHIQHISIHAFVETYDVTFSFYIYSVYGVRSGLIFLTILSVNNSTLFYTISAVLN